MYPSIVVVRAAMVLLLGAISTQAQTDCAFPATATDVPYCGYVEDSSPFSVASFRTGTPAGANWVGGPALDGQGDAAGGFGFALASDMIHSTTAYKKAWLVTDTGTTTGAQGKCLKFAYAMSGLNIEDLKVLLMAWTSEDPTEAITNSSVPVQFRRYDLWKVTESTGGQWKRAQVSFSSLGQFSIAFEAVPNTRNRDSRGYVALDDITFTDGPCDNDCNFDMNFCTWTNPSDADDFDWSLGRGTNKRGTGPSRDQNSFLFRDRITGGYAYIDSSPPRMAAEVARLQSPELTATTDPLCLKFWLNLHGGGIGAVRLLYTPVGGLPTDTRELWKLDTMTQGLDTWYPAQQTVSSSSAFNLALEASVGLPGSGDIGIDTISFTPGPCPGMPPLSSTSWGDCTFFQDTCGWDIEFLADAPCNMLSRVAETNSNPPGHTVNAFGDTDLYMHFDLSCYSDRPRQPISLHKAVEVRAESCLSFWVFMYTAVPTETKIAALSVMLMTASGNQTIWRLHNEQQSDWTYAQVSVPAVGSARVALVATKGRNLIGMIGLDDITVFQGNCEVQPPQARVDPGDCAFDQDLCGWGVVNRDPSLIAPTSNWRFTDGTVVLGLQDHTFGADDGGFVYLDAFNTELTSRLRTPENVTTTTCITFYFATFFRDRLAYLSVVKDTGEADPEVVWRMTQDQMPVDSQHAWMFGRVEVPNTDGLYFEGHVREGGWAIDDVSLRTGITSCKAAPAIAVPDVPAPAPAPAPAPTK